LSDWSAEALDQSPGRNGPTADEQAAVRECEERVQRVLEELPGEHLELLQLRYFRGLSFRAIAQRLGSSPKAARRAVHRALDDLQAFRDRLA
jgi:RNA polymerase sigma factor (sigma-70 family)